MKKTIRLDKYLAVGGYGSRKEIKQLVRGGSVSVNGEVVRDSADHVEPGIDTISVNGNDVIYREYVYLMMNKPSGYISATEDSKDRTVLDLIPEGYSQYRLFPVGRLDKDTEGLLLLTNDGNLAHNLLSPSKHVPKTYYARVRGIATEKDKEIFAEGIVIDGGYKTKPAVLNILITGDVSEVELTIYEGKFHQVKRMFGSLGMDVLYLKRLSMGSLGLDPLLKSGEARELTSEELQLLGKLTV